MKCKACNKPINPEISHGWQRIKSDRVIAFTGPGYEYDYFCYQCGLALSLECREYLEVGCNIYIAKLQ